MVKKFKTFGPQLVFAEQTAGSVVVTNEQKLSLYKKSQKSGISTDILEEVYRRGYQIWNESFGQTPEQFAFDRVNSFIAGGFAANLDEDLMINEGKKFIIYKRTDAASGGHQVPNLTFDKKDDAHAHIEKLAPGDYEVRKGWAGGTKTSRAELAKKIGMNEGKRGLWDNIHAKRERIKNGSGEHMRKPGSKGAPTDEALRASQTNEAVNLAQQAAIAIAMKKAGKKPQNEEADPCWKGYNQIGMKMKNGRKVPNCVPVKEDVKLHKGKHFTTGETVEKQSKNPNDPDSRFDGTKSAKNVYQRSTPGQPVTEESSVDAERKTTERAKLLDDLIAKSKEQPVKTSVGKADERRQFSSAGEVVTNTDTKTGAQTKTIIPNQATIRKNAPAMTNALTTIKRVVKEAQNIDEDSSDSKYKNPEGGLTKAGVMAYRREHPGSKLQTAVTTPPSKLKKGSKAANRRKSFCARMGGMKKRLTSAKTARDPDSRINKALRKWNC